MADMKKVYEFSPNYEPVYYSTVEVSHIVDEVGPSEGHKI